MVQTERSLGRVPRVVLAHVNVAPFVQQAARGFHDAGMLSRMLTTVIDRPYGAGQRIAVHVARFLRFDLSTQLHRRTVQDIPACFVGTRSWPEFIRLAIGRVDRTGITSDLAHEWMETGFDRWVASKLSGANIVYGYENACSATFRAAAARGLFCVYDAPAPEHRFSRAILEAEYSSDNNLNTAYQRHVNNAARERRRDGRRQAEYANANLIVTASTVTRDSFADYFRARGRVNEIDKLIVIPYGAPVPDPSGSAGGSESHGPVRFLWAGTFSVRKGARYLLEAWRQLAAGAHTAVLDIYGTVTVPPVVCDSLPANVRFHNPVSRNELTQIYRDADLLLFPTLCDGFGMVATEALANGLPVLTTSRAGSADLIQEGRNGLIVPPADTKSLTEALRWSIENRSTLANMRAAALETAARWQWSDYRKELVRIVLERYHEWKTNRR